MRFAPNNFQYNGRVALALLPSLCVVAGFGGKLPLGVIVVREYSLVLTHSLGVPKL